LYLARYTNSDGNFVLVVWLGRPEANKLKELIEIVYDFLIGAIQLSASWVVELGVGAVRFK
jgi:hypothetical protein